MAVDYAALKVGDRISDRTYRMDAASVAKYVDAVMDRSGIFDPGAQGAVVPAMAIAALSMRGVVNDLGIPGGTVHVAQELEFHIVARVGETLECKAKIFQNSTRVGWRFLVVRLSVEDGSGEPVMTGKSTIMLPV
ncbi:MAG: hypothetical protein FJ319_01855 [SAR202 cluster bacterium]|nr:hypothetical protein [SAR202 cluster bacterium]